MCINEQNILVVGLPGKSQALRELPARVVKLDTGAQALQLLRRESIDTVVSRWDLPDLPDGVLLKNLTAAKPGTSTVAFVKTGDTRQEIDARSLGINAVLSEDVDNNYFRETICQLLGLPGLDPICISQASAFEDPQTYSLSGEN